MGIRKKAAVVLAFLVGGALASILGHRHFAQKIAPSLAQKSTRLEFELLETEGNLFTSAQRLRGRGAVLFYLPDDISLDTQRKYAGIVRAGANRRVKTKDLILISSLDVDNLRNMKRIAAFDGPFLVDPSGSLLGKVRKWSPERTKGEWTSIELGKTGEILRLATGATPELSWLE